MLAVFASGFVGDDPVGAATLEQLRSDGAAWIGVGIALLVLAGVRSGSRGGPIALDATDVHHLLLAPVSRSLVLRRPVVSVVGYGVVGAAIVGALVGSLAAQRLPGSNTAWVLAGAALFAGSVALAIGAALTTASRRIPSWLMVGLALALLAWSVAAALQPDAVPRSPLGVLGGIALWPLAAAPWSFAVLAVAAMLVLVGGAGIGGLSIEDARRRTRLVGQLRFAVTQQDLRSVLLLRRQLAAERPRSRPLPVPLPRSVRARLPVLTRDLQSIARWPLVRILRVTGLGALAGASLHAVWGGTTPMVLVAGIALYLVALDALEPLAQEIDHPTLVASYPMRRGLLMVHHLAAPSIAIAMAGVVGVATAWALDPSADTLRIGAVTLVAATGCAVGAGAISIVSEAVLDQSGEAMLPPEVAGPRVVIRTLWPPLVAVIGVTPVLAAQRADRGGGDAFAAAALVATLAWLLVLAIGAWVRYRDDLHATMQQAVRGET